jgi:16S rRNA (adenine1518-N6/adenine1519-N6)-dimethyltransferase
MLEPKKSLGQHWLKDEVLLEQIAELAELGPADSVLEIGPGPGSLTKLLVKKAGSVTAVELDEKLAAALVQDFAEANLTVVSQDILKFDLGQLMPGYKVVANIPYYLTGNLLRVLTESTNPPSLMVLLVQKEVAERLAAGPGQMSLLAVSVQLDYETQLGPVVPAELFMPPPKVDSQVIKLSRRSQPLFDALDRQVYLSVVRAGFSERRKKLRSSLAGGLRQSKENVDQWLASAGIDPNRRAQELSLQEWHQLYSTWLSRLADKPLPRS